MNIGIDLKRIASAARSLARRLPPGVMVDAEDLEHEGVLAALRGRKSAFGPMKDCLRKQGWMQECRAGYRHRPVRVDFSVCTHIAAPGDGPDLVSAKRRMELKVTEAVRSLDSRHREVIRLRYWQSLRLAEIAGLLGVNKSRAWQIEQEAIVKLRAGLEETGVTA